MGRDAAPDPGFRATGFSLRAWRLAAESASAAQVKRRFDKIRNSGGRASIRTACALAWGFAGRWWRGAERLRRELEGAGAEAWDIDAVQGLMDHALRQIDQRLLQGEAIPHEEKVFSIFEPHTRWCAKGEAGRMVEPGVPVCIVEDRASNWSCTTASRGRKTTWMRRFRCCRRPSPCFRRWRGCSFDRGFHGPSNRVRLDALLDCNALPAKGTLSQKAREREACPKFAAARRQHPEVESAIHNLECRGLDRVRAHGRDGFARTVALAILAANLHRISLVLQGAERDKIQIQRRQGIRPRRLTVAGRANAVGMRPGPGRGPSSWRKIAGILDIRA